MPKRKDPIFPVQKLLSMTDEMSEAVKKYSDRDEHLRNASEFMRNSVCLMVECTKVMDYYSSVTDKKMSSEQAIKIIVDALEVKLSSGAKKKDARTILREINIMSSAESVED